MSGVMWQIGKLLLDVRIKLFYNDRAYPSIKSLENTHKNQIVSYY
jgi:hypothetical protein